MHSSMLGVGKAQYPLRLLSARRGDEGGRHAWPGVARITMPFLSSPLLQAAGTLSLAAKARLALLATSLLGVVAYLLTAFVLKV